MTCIEAKKISLESILDKVGAKKVKQINREIWYISPFRDETTASFKIDIIKNLWYDHGEGKGGNVLDFVMRYYTCDIKEALVILENESLSFHQPIYKSSASEKEDTYKITSISSVENKLLTKYAEERGLNLTLLHRYCKEIHYERDNKIYFGIGFKNVLKGYEIRNKYFKGCLGNKGITTIENDCNQVILFEGWIDFLSLLILYPMTEYRFDFIILNSTSQKESVLELIVKYNKICLCFDNDLTGNETTIYFQKKYENLTKDIRYLFKGYKDLNEYLMMKSNEL
ncbi:toprim domain-containing protein [Myroides sp. M-43]|uniref:toprim domain-containing protein n=1 Tax=Myroides oncorhynchi TaxID=2893756 RepID=UPI001E5F4178|nr:toprim domain-containing protein [Myroides oncorhynchi]MCC9042569.1 toprim domain-containing protein [Myroides oncorhynchi]